ncbi:MAG TPA: cysteine methyltransferase [Ruminococcaceae bacterium]|nr:cysteine methyltransferase [Oscillospiraceae bacterium]
MIVYSEYNSDLGTLTLAADGNKLIGLWIEGQKYFLSTIGEAVTRDDNNTAIVKAKSWLDRYFRGERPSISELELAPSGSEFRRAVWKILCGIPYGEVITYGEIAKEIARQNGLSSMSAQAVGNAVGHNPISIIIPCHRVVGTNGSLTGYAGGIDKKIYLLRHEGVDTDKFYDPGN